MVFTAIHAMGGGTTREGLLSTRVKQSLLGMVAVAISFGAVALTWFFLQGGFRSGYPVDAVFSAPGVGQQLPENGDVKIRGVLVGTISDVKLAEDNTARVTMLLKDEVRLPADTGAEIRSKTVFGQKWVELIPSSIDPGSDVLEAGSFIPDSLTREPLELERALKLGHELLSEIPLDDLTEVFSTLAEGFSGNEEDARLAIDRGLVALKAVNSRSKEFDLSFRQLAEFSSWLDSNDETLLGFMAALDLNNRALIGAAPELRANLQSVPTFFDDFADLQVRIENDLGRLVEDGATLAEILAPRSDDLRDLIVNLEAFTTVWNSGLSQPCGGLYEQDMTCWQVYQMPGLESRGLYRKGEAPDEDEPGDPNYRVRSSGRSALDDMLDAYRAGAEPSELSQVLMGPVLTPAGEGR